MTMFKATTQVNTWTWCSITDKELQAHYYPLYLAGPCKHPEIKEDVYNQRIPCKQTYKLRHVMIRVS